MDREKRSKKNPASFTVVTELQYLQLIYGSYTWRTTPGTFDTLCLASYFARRNMFKLPPHLRTWRGRGGARWLTVIENAGLAKHKQG